MTRDGAQYLLPDGVGPEAASKLVAAHLEVERERPRSADRTFYDTFDGRLYAAGLVLTYEGGKPNPSGRLVLADRAGYSRSAADCSTAPTRLFASELSPGPLRDLLEPVVKARALTPIARVRGRLHPLHVLDDEAKTVVKLLVEEVSVAGKGRSRLQLRPRIRVLPVRGYEKAIVRVRHTLEAELNLPDAAVSLQDEAVSAAGGTPGGISSKLDLVLSSAERADRATAAALAGPLATMNATLPGTLDDVDTEFLHDLRVAVRRTRSLQRQLKSVFPPEPLAHFRAEFRRLQQVTGAVRDLDVHQVELDEFRSGAPKALAADLEPLQATLAMERRAEFRRMARALRSPRTTDLIAAWSSFLEDLPDAPEADRPDARERIAGVAAGRITTVYRRMVKMGRAIDDDSPPEALHDLRKKGKELRYMLEFFASLFPPEAVKPTLRKLKGLQDVLGRYQDQEVQADRLRAVREKVGALDGGAAALMAMGVLVEGLEQQHAAARREFAERFAPFAAKGQRALMGEAFA
ncbi:CHAD domain-containing protein [soil metagenome]